MYMFKCAKLAIPLTIAFASAAASATPIMPDFATVPAGWTVDRYAPASFTNVGSFEGRANVLGIGIDSSTNQANRPAGFASSFYNTQGMAHTAVGGMGSVLGADLYIPESWGNAANGSVRTDMWGVATNAANAVSAYGIVGFTNYGGAARLRAYDEQVAGGWVDLASGINFNDWTAMEIEFTGGALVYRINGAVAYIDNTVGATTGFGSVLMQAYNFADASIQGANPLPYVAHWSNTAAADVPEPGTLALFGLGLLGAVAMRRRTRRG